jgi:hypothetical protein
LVVNHNAHITASETLSITIGGDAKPIGIDKFSNFQPTSTFTILTDKFDNLVTATPGKMK